MRKEADIIWEGGDVEVLLSPDPNGSDPHQADGHQVSLENLWRRGRALTIRPLSLCCAPAVLAGPEFSLLSHS